VGKHEALEQVEVDGSIIVIWNFRKWNVGSGLERTGTG